MGSLMLTRLLPRTHIWLWLKRVVPKWHHGTSGRRKSPHVASSHPSHPQPLGTTHIRLSHSMRFKSSHFLQNTMGTELEGRCCQPQEFTALCTHMLKTHRASAARAPGEPRPHPNEDSFRWWHNFKCCGTRRENHPVAVNIHACTRHMEAYQMLNIIHFACAQHRIMRFPKMTCLRQLSLHPQTQRAHSPGTT